MRIHTQNLNESKTRIGSMFWAGRGWLHNKWKEIHWEWYFGHKATNCQAKLYFGNGDDDAGVLVSLGLPFLFQIYFGIAGVLRCKECEIGVAIHSNTFWIYTLSYCNEWSRDMPWWRKGWSWSFPWQLEWHSTEILEHKAPICAKTVHLERQGDRKRLGLDSFEMMRQTDAIKATVSETYDYTYTRKNGEIQKRKAKVYVDRMTWRARWWPLVPVTKIRNCINVQFDEEVGEKVGTWKGGCVGCGYDFEYPNETPLECLRRMEAEREFN